MARVRIGDTHLTRCFLLKGEDPPQCTACDCQLTVKDILFECADFIESRNRHFSVNSFRELFEKVPPDSISSYLHEIGLFYGLQNNNNRGPLFYTNIMALNGLCMQMCL